MRCAAAAPARRQAASAPQPPATAAAAAAPPPRRLPRPTTAELRAGRAAPAAGGYTGVAAAGALQLPRHPRLLIAAVGGHTAPRWLRSAAQPLLRPLAPRLPAPLLLAAAAALPPLLPSLAAARPAVKAAQGRAARRTPATPHARPTGADQSGRGRRAAGCHTAAPPPTCPRRHGGAGLRSVAARRHGATTARLPAARARRCCSLLLPLGRGTPPAAAASQRSAAACAAAAAAPQPAALPPAPGGAAAGPADPWSRNRQPRELPLALLPLM